MRKNNENRHFLIINVNQRCNYLKCISLFDQFKCRLTELLKVEMKSSIFVVKIQFKAKFKKSSKLHFIKEKHNEKFK